MKVDEVHENRRMRIQARSKATYRRRVLSSQLFLLVSLLMLLVALVPLYSILENVIGNGAHVVTANFLTQPQSLPTLFQQDAYGGVSNAIVGSIVVDGLAVLIAVPVSILLAIALFELRGKVMNRFRMVIEIMVGLPSILLGVFIYGIVVVPLHFRYMAIAGSLALALLMVPLMTVASLAALEAVPITLKEAALALGARQSRVMSKVLLPYATPRILTGILLSLSRAVGETAPLLFVIGTSMVVTWNPLEQTSTLPSLTFNYLQSMYEPVRQACWGIALIIMVSVFILNLTGRLIVARSNKK